jgi:hypothetical protein
MIKIGSPGGIVLTGEKLSAQGKTYPFATFAPQISRVLPMILCVEKTAAKHMNCDMATC